MTTLSEILEILFIIICVSVSTGLLFMCIDAIVRLIKGLYDVLREHDDYNPECDDPVFYNYKNNPDKN